MLRLNALVGVYLFLRVNSQEGTLVGHPSCFAVSSLSDVYQHLYHGIDASYIPKKNIDQIQISSDDMRDIVGQEQAKRALLIAAAGQHHILIN